MIRYDTLTDGTVTTTYDPFDYREKIKVLIKQGAELSDQTAIRDIIQSDRISRQKRYARSSRKYFDVDNEYIHDVNFNKFTTAEDLRDSDGKPSGNFLVKEVTANAANRKLRHGIYSQIVAQKATTAIADSVTFSFEDQNLENLFLEYIPDSFTMDIINTCINAFNDGQSAWYFYYPEDAEETTRIKYIPIEGLELIPVYDKETQQKLQQVIRYYTLTFDQDGETTRQNIVEIWSNSGVEIWKQKEKGDYLFDEHRSLLTRDVVVGGEKIEEDVFDLGRPPFAMLFNNRSRLSELVMGKDLLDEYDYTRSLLSNDIADIKEQLTVVEGAAGENADELRHNMYIHKLILTNEGQKANALDVPIQYEARKEHWERTREDIFANFQAVDYYSSAFRSATTGKALQQLHKGLFEKVKLFRPYLNSFMRDVIYFIIMDINRINNSKYKVSDVSFNIPIAEIIDDTEVITNVTMAYGAGLLDNETAITILANHLPGNIDPQVVMERLQENVPLIENADTEEQ